MSIKPVVTCPLFRGGASSCSKNRISLSTTGTTKYLIKTQRNVLPFWPRQRISTVVWKSYPTARFKQSSENLLRNNTVLWPHGFYYTCRDQFLKKFNKRKVGQNVSSTFDFAELFCLLSRIPTGLLQFVIITGCIRPCQKDTITEINALTVLNNTIRP